MVYAMGAEAWNIRQMYGEIESGRDSRSGEAYPKVGAKTMWYVIQTISGKEKTVVEAIDNILSGEGYERCFVPQRECIWRIEGKYRIHTEPLFPSYVFAETDTPESFFFALKRVPKLTKLLGAEGTFWNVEEEEEKQLRSFMEEDGEFVVRRSLVRVDEEGNILSAQGALNGYVGKIIKKRLRKRSVVVEIPFLGETRKIQLGIRLEGEE